MTIKNYSHRKSIALWAGGLAVAGALAAGCAQRHSVSSAQNAGGTTLRVGFVSSSARTPGGPEGWADLKGFLRPELRKIGISDVKFTPFTSGPFMNEALAAGSLDIGVIGDTPAIVARSAGLDTVAINQAQLGMDAWLVSAPNGPTTISQLTGKRIGVTKGGYVSRYLTGALLENHLQGNVKIVQMTSPEAQPALTRGDLGAYAAGIGVAQLLAAQGFHVLDKASQHKGLLGSTVTVANKKWLAAHADFPAVWQKVRVQSIADLRAHPDEFYQFTAKNSRLPVDIAKQAYPLTLYSDQTFTPDGLSQLEQTKQFLLGQKLARQDFPLQSWVLSPSANAVASR